MLGAWLHASTDTMYTGHLHQVAIVYLSSSCGNARMYIQLEKICIHVTKNFCKHHICKHFYSSKNVVNHDMCCIKQVPYTVLQ